MAKNMYRLIALLIGYVLGSIQTAYFVGKIHGIDIREHGSKGAGMTNVTRTLGKRAGAFVFVVDLLKGVVAFVIASLLFGGEGTYADCGFGEYDLDEYGNCLCYMLGGSHSIMRNVLSGIYAGVGTILGHCFPVWLKFRGGKGVACTLGLILMIDWRVALFAYVLGIIAVAATRYISLASLIITFIVPVTMWFVGYNHEAVGIMAGVCILIWYLHRGNIQRLLDGTERKFLKKTEPPPAE
ncbi:MAG: glycerol-3-phosphate 1-O-acyltransferase PlsY [Defluviitaleaceae bacterium]|nr:glycerol-3-phosphate 1-O-acyltransferase PlsY [Defluviitaleaceae bacterium]